MQALIRLYEGSMKARLRLYSATCMAYMLAATLWSIGPPASVSRPRTRLVLRLYSGSITALLRLYQGSITDLLKLYCGSAGPSRSRVSSWNLPAFISGVNFCMCQYLYFCTCSATNKDYPVARTHLGKKKHAAHRCQYWYFCASKASND